MTHKKILATGIDKTQLVIFDEYLKSNIELEGCQLIVDIGCQKTWDKIANKRRIKYKVNKRWRISRAYAFITFVKYLFCILTLNGKKLKGLTEKNIKNLLLLSAWESASKDMKNDTIAPKRIILLIHYLNCIRAYYNARLAIMEGYNELWTAHLVYEFRLVNFAYQEQKLKVLVLTLDELRYTTQPLNECYDTHMKESIANQIEEANRYDLIQKLTVLKNINEKIKKVNTQPTKITQDYKNILYLHVLNDSPFHYYSKKRIFTDYIDWITITFDIIRNNKEKWWVKIHPHSASWNDSVDQKLAAIVNSKGWPDNIEMLPVDIPSSICLKSSVKNVTFCGSVAKEAAMIGRKPIIINDCVVSEISDKLCFLPSSIAEYEALLSDNMPDQTFELEASDIELVRNYVEISNLQKGLNLRKLAYAPAALMHQGISHEEATKIMDELIW